MEENNVGYESIIIIKSDLKKEILQETIEKVENKIMEYATITKKEDMGVRKLAYDIKDNKEGHYLLHEFEVVENKTNEAIAEIERLYRITDEILKFIIVKRG